MAETLKHNTRSELRLHAGSVILRLAKQYPTLKLVILELVQNGLDVDATEIMVAVDRRQRTLHVWDNGDGVSIDGFNQALGTVGKSIKEQGRGRLGRFGIGMISPLSVCDEYRFISTPRGHDDAYREWTFKRKVIEESAEAVSIPNRRAEIYYFDPSGHHENAVSWRTTVALKGYSIDRVVSELDIDDLVSQITDKFGEVMRRRKVLVKLSITDERGETKKRTVEVTKWTGRPLPEEQVKDGDCGTVTFRIFRAVAKSGKPKGRVVVGESGNPFRLGFDQFAKGVGDLISSRVRAALTDGFFEGEILCSGIKLEVSRTRFMESDALVAFCLQIESWFERVAGPLLEDMARVKQGERLQRIGEKVCDEIEVMLQSPEFTDIRSFVESIPTGTVGKGHTEPTGGVVGPEDVTSIRTSPTSSGGGGPKRKPGGGGGGGGGEPREPYGEREDDVPVTVGGPRGERRVQVKGNSPGLQLIYDPMPWSSDLWSFDARSGRLSINIRHPLWARCEPKDDWTSALTRFVWITALTLNALPEDYRTAEQRLATDEVTKGFVFCLTQAPPPPRPVAPTVSKRQQKRDARSSWAPPPRRKAK